MSKIAQYLSEHILGEVTSAESVRKRFSRDGSILNITPELIVHPRVTNDIRKVARFTWQLAEKGHVMPITARGGGSNQTGASIGKGIIVNTVAHLNNIIFINQKNKDQFVHTQPGVKFGTLNAVLKSHGMIIPTYPSSSDYSTIGGAVADNVGGSMSGLYGLTGDWVTRLEVVLANGDLIETTRINRRELSKKKGLQTFEGELYRKIDGIIEDNQQLIKDDIAKITRDNTGYPGIAKVKLRDGSFDLSPLFVGSQGTLGIISEIVLKADYYNTEESIVVASFESSEVARDAADSLVSLQPASLDYLDGRLFNIARTSYNKKYIFSSDNIGAVIFISFNDFNDHARRRKIKQTLKKLSKLKTTIFTSDDHSIDELRAIADVGSVIMQSDSKDESSPSLIDGAAISNDRREEFIDALEELAKKHHIALPVQIQWLDGIIHARPTLNLHNISDKQKTFKLISDYIELVVKFNGSISAESGEGRLRATAAYANMNKDVLDIYQQIRTAFDPFGTLNPGVKQESDLKTLVSQLNPDYSLADFAEYSPKV
jgi:FAD/FMN-containing dehydrogenase